MAETSTFQLMKTSPFPSFIIPHHRNSKLHYKTLNFTPKKPIKFLCLTTSTTSNDTTTSSTPTTTMVSPIRWGCDADSLENAEALQKWLSSSGLPAQKLRIEKVEVGERGLVAVNNVRKGEKLLFIPPELVITPESIVNQFDLAAVSEPFPPMLLEL